MDREEFEKQADSIGDELTPHQKILAHQWEKGVLRDIIITATPGGPCTSFDQVGQADLLIGLAKEALHQIAREIGPQLIETPDRIREELVSKCSSRVASEFRKALHSECEDPENPCDAHKTMKGCKCVWHAVPN